MLAYLPPWALSALIEVFGLAHRHHGVVHHATRILGFAVKAFVIVIVLIVLVFVLLAALLVSMFRRRRPAE